MNIFFSLSLSKDYVLFTFTLFCCKVLISIDFTNESYFDRAGNSDLTISIRILDHNQIKISIDILKSGVNSDFGWEIQLDFGALHFGLKYSNLDYQPCPAINQAPTSGILLFLMECLCPLNSGHFVEFIFFSMINSSIIFHYNLILF